MLQHQTPPPGRQYNPNSSSTDCSSSTCELPLGTAAEAGGRGHSTQQQGQQRAQQGQQQQQETKRYNSHHSASTSRDPSLSPPEQTATGSSDSNIRINSSNSGVNSSSSSSRVNSSSSSSTPPAATAPVVFFCHGGIWATGERWHFAPLATRLAQSGIVVVVISYTLYPEALATQMACEVLEALLWTLGNVQRFLGDPNRVSVVGHSAGGHLGALAVMLLAEERHMEKEVLLQKQQQQQQGRRAWPEEQGWEEGVQGQQQQQQQQGESGQVGQPRQQGWGRGVQGGQQQRGEQQRRGLQQQQLQQLQQLQQQQAEPLHGLQQQQWSQLLPSIWQQWQQEEANAPSASNSSSRETGMFPVTAAPQAAAGGGAAAAAAAAGRGGTGEVKGPQASAVLGPAVPTTPMPASGVSGLAPWQLQSPPSALSLPLPVIFIGMSGVYDVAKHFEYEMSRGRHQLSTMGRACGGHIQMGEVSPVTILVRAAAAASGDSAIAAAAEGLSGISAAEAARQQSEQQEQQQWQGLQHEQQQGLEQQRGQQQGLSRVGPSVSVRDAAAARDGGGLATKSTERTTAAATAVAEEGAGGGGERSPRLEGGSWTINLNPEVEASSRAVSFYEGFQLAGEAIPARAGLDGSRSIITNSSNSSSNNGSSSEASPGSRIDWSSGSGSGSSSSGSTRDYYMSSSSSSNGGGGWSNSSSSSGSAMERHMSGHGSGSNSSSGSNTCLSAPRQLADWHAMDAAAALRHFSRAAAQQQLPPCILMSSCGDVMVPWHEAAEMAAAVQACGVPVKHLIYNTPAHNDFVMDWHVLWGTDSSSSGGGERKGSSSSNSSSTGSGAAGAVGNGEEDLRGLPGFARDLVNIVKGKVRVQYSMPRL